MSDRDSGAPHLTDADIDAYWKDQLPDAEVERIEQHFLECDDCQLRTRAVGELIDHLRAPRAEPASGAGGVAFWRIAASILAAASVVAVWQWARQADAVRDLNARLERAGASREAPGPSPLVVPLLPPTRDASVPAVTLPAQGVVVFHLDAREAGPAGTAFRVTLSGPGRQLILQLNGVSSSAAGAVQVPVEASLLPSGSYTFELRAGDTGAGFPFLIRR